MRAHPRAVEYVDRLLSRDPRAVYEDEAAANPIFAPANDDGWISTKSRRRRPAPPPRRGPPQPVQRGRRGAPGRRPSRPAPPGRRHRQPQNERTAAGREARGAGAGAAHGGDPRRRRELRRRRLRPCGDAARARDQSPRARDRPRALAARAQPPPRRPRGDDTGQTGHARGRPHAVAAAGVVASPPPAVPSRRPSTRACPTWYR